MSEHEESETGTVSFFNAERGFGFIVPDHAGGDIFVGMAALDRAGLDTLPHWPARPLSPGARPERQPPSRP